MKSVHYTKLAPHVVIVELDEFVGLQTARIFARRRIPIIGVVADPNHFCCRTNVCEKILSIPKNKDLIGFLTSLGQGLEQKAVLVPCGDSSVLLISQYRQILKPYYYISLPEHEIVEMLMDKPRFYQYALKEDLQIANFFLLHSREDAEKAVQNLKFPCILKPPLADENWFRHSWLKAYKIFNVKEFISIYDRCSNWAEVLMAQEWISGADKNLYSCNCYFNAKSEPIITFTSRKLRQWPPEVGKTSLGEECRNDVVLNETIHLFKKLNFRGLGYLEMKRDDSGKYYIIEPNIGRPTGRSALAEACGVELLYTMYCDNVGWPIPEKTKQKYIGVKWIYLSTDLQSALNYWRRGDLKIKDWWRSLRGRKTYAVLSLSDPLPFLEELRLWIMYRIKIMLNKITNNKDGPANGI